MEKEHVTQITKGEVYLLSNAIKDLSISSPSIKGKIVFALSKNEGKMEPVLKKTDQMQKEIIDKYVKIDKDGNYVLKELTEEEIKQGIPREYIYKDPKNGKEKASNEMNALMSEPVEIDFHKIWINDFNNLDVVPARNTKIGMLIKYLVSEEMDSQLTNMCVV